ncbi:MAG: glycoside hydrolase family 2 protein [Lachnospiraceae bacterium]
MESQVFNFNYGWKFKLADAFPLKQALKATADASGHFFYEREYEEEGWKEISVPHTYNDEDLFVNRIQDAGSDQKRTFSCYRKWFTVPKEHRGKKVFLEFEGIRQTCYLYVNGTMAGYYEAGVAPFGFDLTPYLHESGENLIAVATDSTSSRNLDYFGAETPNLPGAEPGRFITSLNVEETIPEEHRGVGFFWNCNDFNPCLGGLTKNIRLHIKPMVYLTLPLYSNLRTKGIYIYGKDYDIKEKTAVICSDAEVRNESGSPIQALIRTTVADHTGRSILSFTSEETEILPAKDLDTAIRLSITPADAYEKTEHGYRARGEEEVGPVETDSIDCTNICSQARAEELRFWCCEDPYLYTVTTELICGETVMDRVEMVTGFRKVSYDGQEGLKVNDVRVWLTGYAQRAANEWAAIGAATDWLKDMDARLIRESNANHIRFMHVAGCPADIRSFDRFGVICTQPAGDKERENFGRQWKQRVELMRDVIIYFRNSPSILFWETGNNSISKEHMREMRLIKETLDPMGGRFIGCRTINTEEVICEAEYVGTMLNRHAARFQSERMPVTETEYLREEAPRRVWDDFTPPDYDYDNLWLGKGGRKQNGGDNHDLTSEDLALCAARGYAEFFNDRIGGASGKNLYTAAAALCWTDSAQHGRQAFSENARMSGRVDPVRIKKQNFKVFQTLQSAKPMVSIVGHWNYPKEGPETYRYALKEFDGTYWRKTGEYAYRNPKDKTIYVIGSYAVAKVELFINGSLAGVCEKPQDTFVFAFPHMDITQSGAIEARAYDYAGNPAASDRIETTGEPAALRLTVHTGEKGLLADGSDLAYVDVEAVDEQGRVCPLCDRKITFSFEGPGVFLGGYNSGKFNGYGRHDSVIHTDHVYAECGNNRVFIRAGKEAGEMVLKAEMEGVPQAEIRVTSVSCDTSALAAEGPQHLTPEYGACAPEVSYGYEAIPEADAAKYVPLDKVYCKVLVNGQEPDTRSILSIVDHGAIYSPILFILERMKSQKPEAFDYSYENKVLTIRSGGHVVQAEVGRTHLLVDGEENLLNGQPYENEDRVFIVEINAVVPYIQGVSSWYDDKINVFRIEW